MHTLTARLPYSDALPLYRRIKNEVPSCLFESASAVDKSSRLSVIGLEPTLELVGKDDHLDASAPASARPVFFMHSFNGNMVLLSRTSGMIVCACAFLKHLFRERRKTVLDRQNIVQPLRKVLAEFHSSDKNFMGFYGALSYQFYLPV